MQWGYEPQFQDLRAQGSYWGAGSLVADDGTTAQIPEHWADAWKWLYDGIWTDHFIMNEAQPQDPTIGATATSSTRARCHGAHHLWYTCCIADRRGRQLVRSRTGTSPPCRQTTATVTANFNADTFRILEASEHPEEAFEFLTYLIGETRPAAAPALRRMPGVLRTRRRSSPVSTSGAPRVSTGRWRRGLDPELPDNPSFEGYMPNYQEAFSAIQAELDKLRARLTSIWTLRSQPSRRSCRPSSTEPNR